MAFYDIESFYQLMKQRFPVDPIIEKKRDPKIPWFEQIEPIKYRKTDLNSKKLNLNDKKDLQFADELLITLLRISAQLRYDSRLIKLFYEYKNLPLFFENLLENLIEPLKSAFIKTKKDIISFLYEWENIMENKVEIVSRTSNEHLHDLPFPSEEGFFPVKVLELNASNTLKVIHPVNKYQANVQKTRSNEQLILYDSKDPITGFRVRRSQDKNKWAASEIYLKSGHHRVHEIYPRYLQGLIDGNMLMQFKEIRDN